MDEADHLIIKDTSTQEARLEVQYVNYLLDSDPHNPHLWFRKALRFQNAMVGSISEKVSLETTLLWYKQCLTDWPSLWAVHHNRAVVLRKLNRYQEALEAARQSVELNPKNKVGWELMAATLVRLGRPREAHRVFGEAAKVGVQLNPEIIGLTNSEEKVDDERDRGRKQTDPGLVKEIFKNPEQVHQRLAESTVTFVFEAADPELFTLQFELDELLNLGLYTIAQDLCIQFELVHGPNNLTQSFFIRIKSAEKELDYNDQLDVSPAYPLLDIASRYFNFTYIQIINRLIKEKGIERFITPMDMDDFDEQIRWHFDHLGKTDFDINDPSSATKPLSPQLVLVWNMAVLNFIVARKSNNPLLIAYTATTLAEFYSRLGKSNLPLILYRVAARSASHAGQYDYAVNAHGTCALIFMGKDQLGAALSHLKTALRFEDRIQAPNKFELYRTLGSCYSKLHSYEAAKKYYRKATEVKGVPDSLREHALLCLAGVEVFERREVAHCAAPPIFHKDLLTHTHEFDTPAGLTNFMVTSNHELYDSLLQYFHNVVNIRQSLIERKTGRNYYQEYYEALDLLIQTAVQVGLTGNALIHLEAQKSLILTNRLRYILKAKPSEIPTALWDQIQRLVNEYRQAVEQSDEPDIDLDRFPFFTTGELVDSIRAKLWECAQISEIDSARLEQKLAFGEIPEKIEFPASGETLIMEFFCGKEGGACFLIKPDQPHRPTVVPLPRASLRECEDLATTFNESIQRWIEFIEQPHSFATAPSFRELRDFLRKLDEILYNPIAHGLDDISVSRVCIIPHRILHVLPLNLLGYSQTGRYLAQRFILSFSPSLLSFHHLSQSPLVKIRKALIVADPVPQCPSNVCRNVSRNCFSIAGAAAEGKSLRSRLEAEKVETKYLGSSGATLDSIINELSDANIVHFASHGFFNLSVPEKSGILLNCITGQTKKNRLYLQHNGELSRDSTNAVGEILSLDYLWEHVDMFNCRFLNLSACSTGMIDWTERSDEFYGISNGFLYAGVESILSAVWPVHDLLAELFNKLFYDEYIACEYKPALALKLTTDKFTHLGIDEIFELLGSRNDAEKTNVKRQFQVLIKKAKDSDFNNGTEQTPFAHPFFWGGYRMFGIPC